MSTKSILIYKNLTPEKVIGLIKQKGKFIFWNSSIRYPGTRLVVQTI
jgi:hypothetical protein